MNILSIFLAIFPGLVICFLVFRFDKFEKEMPIPLLICFGLGILSTVPALYLEAIGEKMGIVESPDFWMTLLLSFVVVALTEELMKFLCLILYPYRKAFFSEPLDGIIYAVMIGMGFATLENVIYATRLGIETVGIRAFTAVPAHGAFAVISGFFVGRAKFEKEKSLQLLAIGLFSAVFLHGLYDFFILQQTYEWLMSFSTLVLMVSFYLSWRMLKSHQLHSSKYEIQKKPPIANTLSVESDTQVQIKEPEAEIMDIEENEIMDAVLDQLQAEDKKEEEE